MLRQLIIVAALFGVGLAQRDEIDAVASACTKEMRLMRPSRWFYCILECMGPKLGVISEDGIINEPRFQQLYNVSAENLKAAIANCPDETIEDTCSKIGYKYYCVLDVLVPKFHE